MLAGRYRLDVRLGAGGMGEVWRGEDTVLARTVAVKVLLPGRMDDPGFAARFQGEARAMATINHPGVVDVYDYGVSDVPGDGPTAYLVMRFVDGEPLDRLLTRLTRIAPEPAMELIAQAASALQAVHDRGIVHRDVKPGNLLVRPDGTLVLTDFGIARADVGHRLTDAGMVLGTAAYCAPEQAEGQPVTPAVDLYALGVVAYECLAGHRPFDGDTPVTIALKHIREDPPPLPADVPPAVRHLVERALVKDPARRWRSAAEMSVAARRAMRDGSGAMGVSGVTGLTGMVSSEHTTTMGGNPHQGAGYPQQTAGHPHQFASPETGVRMGPAGWGDGEAGPSTAPPPPYIMPAAGPPTGAHSPPTTATAGPPVQRGSRGRRKTAPQRGKAGLIVGVIAVGALLGGVGAVAYNQIASAGASAEVEGTQSPSPSEGEPSPTKPARSPRPVQSPRPTVAGSGHSEKPSASPTPTSPSPSPSPTKTRSPSPSPSVTKSPAAKRVVPAVINLHQTQATAKLRAAGFKVRVDISGEPSDEGCTRVLDQTPAAGTSWAVDRPVTIVVEQGIPCGDPSESPSPTPTPSAT
ncbi:serine/threonine-protein kinase [Sphaerisporangium perillae]|uniref:serine/threonine-protein kinase n=1 Tax=Sphaerisporangium perillae TaxID=2935860 RepID=UPI00200F72BA|nr:serine/threonine-protein kinase [Sphaerisporangium perillae]